ncbi:MAG: hypothetical protein ABSD57_03150 [Verrucomicrobiota bacterium]|jgi:hypothetical protein
MQPITIAATPQVLISPRYIFTLLAAQRVARNPMPQENSAIASTVPAPKEIR